MRKVAPFLVLLTFLLVAFSATAQSKKQQELEAKRQSLLAEIKQINSLLFKTRGEKKSVLAEVEDLDHRISSRQNLIRVTNQQANLLTREINDNLTTIDQLRKELTTLREDYAAMINKSYKSKSDQSRVMFLFSSENFLQAYKRMQYMKQYTKHRKKQGESIKAKTAELQLLNVSLIQQKKDKDNLIAENKVAKKELDQEKRNQEALVASLKKDEGKFAKQIRSKQKEANRIDKEIDRIVREAIAASNSNTANTVVSASKKTFALTAESKALATNFTNNKGKLPWPIEKGVVVKRFGTTRHPQLANISTYCSGVEIATDENSKARAVFNGVVFKIQKIKGANNAIYIQHGNYITVYYNVVNLLVKKGDKVKTKQLLGTVFTNAGTGKSILKFLIYQNDNRMNPADWIYRM